MVELMSKEMSDGDVLRMLFENEGGTGALMAFVALKAGDKSVLRALAEDQEILAAVRGEVAIATPSREYVVRLREALELIDNGSIY